MNIAKWAVGACVAVVAWGGAARAADPAKAADPSALCPQEAVVYAQTAPVGTLRESIDAFGNVAIGPFYMMAAMEIEGFFASAVGQAIDATRPIGFSLLPPAATGGEPRLLLFVPETDAGALAKGLAALKQGAAADMPQPVPGLAAALFDAEIRSVDGGYAVVGDAADVKAYTPGGKRWDLVLSGTLAASVDVDALRRAFGAEIRSGLQEMERGIGRGIAAGRAAGGADPAGILRVELDLARRLARQASRAEAALSLSEKGASLAFLAAPRPGSAAARFATAQGSGIGTSPLAHLAAKDAWCLVEGRWDASSCAKSIGNAVARLMEASGAPLDAPTRLAMEKMCAAPSSAAYIYRTAPDALVAFSGVAAYPEARIADGMVGLTETLMSGGMQGVSLRAVPAPTPGSPFRFYEIAWEGPMGFPPQVQAAQVQMMEMMYGKKPTFAIGASGSHVVFAMGSDSHAQAEEVRARIEKRPAPAASAPGAWYAALTRLIPAEAQVRVGISFMGVLRVVGRTMAAQTGQNPLAVIEKMALPEGGIGSYVKSSPRGIEVGFVIPVETFGLAQQVIMPLMMGMQGGMGSPDGTGEGVEWGGGR